MTTTQLPLTFAGTVTPAPQVAYTCRLRHTGAVTRPLPGFPGGAVTDLLAQVVSFAPGMPYGANARVPGPKDLNRPVYRQIRDSLLGSRAFAVQNHGLLLVVESLAVLSDTECEVTVLAHQGLVNGGHTYAIMMEHRDGIPTTQHVSVRLLTGIPDDLIPVIAKAQNTGTPVRADAIGNLERRFDAIKARLQDTPYQDRISYGQTTAGDVRVADLIAVLEALNVVDWPNTLGTARDPVAAYDRPGAVLRKFLDDEGRGAAFPRLLPVLPEALALAHVIQHDAVLMHNASGGVSAKLNIVEHGTFDFFFAAGLPGIQQRKHRLTKGALFPILGALRNCVELGPDGGVRWMDGGFPAVLDLWRRLGPSLVATTVDATRVYGRNPDMLGKSREHWRALHTMVLGDRLQAARRRAA